MGEAINDLTIKLIKEAEIHLKSHLDEESLPYISPAELLTVTNEDPEEFLSREPINGYYKPVEYAQNVFDNFINDQTYHFDKLIRSGARD